MENIDEDSPSAILFVNDLVLCDCSRKHLKKRVEVWTERMKGVELKLNRSETRVFFTDDDI